jgi:competence protein ComEC
MNAMQRAPEASGRQRRPFLLAALLLGLLLRPSFGVLADEYAASAASPISATSAANTAVVRDSLFTVTWLETGASLAVALETPAGKTFLIDTGGTRTATASTPDYNAGRDTLSPFLSQHGNKRIDGILISHPHEDHFGGATWLLEHWKVEQFVDHGYPRGATGMPSSYPRLRELAVKDGGTYRAVHAGDTLDWDTDLHVEVLAPHADVFDQPDDGSHSFLNMSSIVLRVQHGSNVFLFPGDAYHAAKEIPVEKLKCVVLTSPHHGFHPDTSNFTSLCGPRHVVVACAADYANNAGTPYTRSPGRTSIEKYGALGIETFVTAFDGHITAQSDGQTVKMSTQRARHIPPTPDAPAK